MPVEVSCDVKGAARHVRTVRIDAQALMDLLGAQRVELSLLLTGDQRIAQLNREYRHKRGPTDVLSFGQIDHAPREPAQAAKRAPLEINNLLGDVVISIDTAARQAGELDQSVGRRLRTLLVHGVLHLMGFDHERPDDARLMFAVADSFEARLTEALGKPRRSSDKLFTKARTAK